MASHMIMIGCGDFGAAAVAYLKERRLPSHEVTWLELSEQKVSRKAGADVVAGKVSANWPELTEAINQVGGGSPLLCVVGFAGEASSGGMLTAALAYLAKAYPRCRRVALVALPDGHESGRIPRAWAYATLIELEHLRQQGAFERCFLYETGKDARLQAPLYVDAALVSSLMTPGTGAGFKSFGVGLVRDPQQVLAGLAPRLAVKVAREVLAAQQGAPGQAAVPGQAAASGQTAAPGQAAGPSGLTATLEQKLAPMLLPAEAMSLFQENCWFARPMGGQPYRHQMESPSYADESVVSNYGSWHRQLVEYGGTRLVNILRERVRAEGKNVVDGLTRTLEYWASNTNVQAAEGAQAIDRLEQMARQRLEASTQRQAEYSRRLEETELLHTQPAWANATRWDRLKALQERDVCQTGIAVEKGLQAWLEIFLTQSLPSFLRPKVEQAQSRAGRSTRLLEALEEAARLPIQSPGEACHVLAPVFGREQEAKAFARVETASLQKQVEWALLQNNPANSVNVIINAAVRALEASVFNPHLPRDDRHRQDWVESLGPGISLGEVPEGLPSSGKTLQATVSARLPADYREDIRLRLGCPVYNIPFSWPYEHEWLVYVDTGTFPLEQLTLLPAWRESYQAAQKQSSGAYLHALPEPEGGWWVPAAQRATPGARPAQAKVVQAVAQTMVRAIALGLLRPTPEGITAQYLSADGGSLVTGTMGSLGEAWGVLISNEAFRTQLDGQACRWRNDLAPAGLAAYGALLQWIARSGIKGADQQQLDSHLRSAAEAECKAVEASLTALGGYWDKLSLAMAAVVASDLDDFSLAEGDWRYVKW